MKNSLLIIMCQLYINMQSLNIRMAYLMLLNVILLRVISGFVIRGEILSLLDRNNEDFCYFINIIYFNFKNNFMDISNKNILYFKNGGVKNSANY